MLKQTRKFHLDDQSAILETVSPFYLLLSGVCVFFAAYPLYMPRMFRIVHLKCYLYSFLCINKIRVTCSLLLSRLGLWILDEPNFGFQMCYVNI